MVRSGVRQGSKGTRLLPCSKCGRHVRYLWWLGALRCRRCVKEAGLNVVYPQQAFLRFPGRLPTVCMDKAA